MLNKILDPSGIPYTETMFLEPPGSTYAVYHDEINRRGGDNINLLSQHDVSIELYEYEPDYEVEALIEEQFDLLGIEYVKQPRTYIESEQLYQVVYDFTYYQKGGK